MTGGAAPRSGGDATLVENIGPKQVRLRWVSGFVALGAGFVTWAAMIFLHASPGARAALWIPFFFAGLGFFQARARVCVAHAASGTCNMDAGPVPVDDPGRAAALRRSARGVYARAAVLAAILAAAAFLVP